MPNRLFLAFDTPHAVVRKLRETYEKNLPLRWVKPENLHLTLLFLGEVEEQDQDRLLVAAGKVAMKYPPIRIRVQKVGPYKSMVWALCHSDPQLSVLVSELTQNIWNAGLPIRRESNFKPHLCLARGRTPEDVKTFPERALEDVGWTASLIVVFKSTLTQKGPTYESLDAFALQA